MRTRRWNLARVTKLACEQMDRMRRVHGMWLDLAGFAPKETAFRILHTEPGIRLRCYGDLARDAPALLIVPAPIKRAYIWDLAPAVSVVRHCLAEGMRVYMVEWTLPDGTVNRFGLTEYADRLLAACVDAIEFDCGRGQVILAGHSLGGTLAAIFSCLHPERIRALVLLEAPLHFGGSAGKFAPLVGAVSDATFIGEAFGNVPGSFLNLMSVAAAPSEFHLQRCMDFSLSVQDRATFESYMRVERWMHDEFPLPGKLFTEVVEQLYREDRLMQGALDIAGRRVGPRDLDVPLLNVVDPRSGVIPPQSILPFHRAASGSPKKVLYYGGDVGVAIQHVGVLAGANAHRRLWPEIFGWLKQIPNHG
jgi:polyhydroxyalkanoate synthase